MKNRDKNESRPSHAKNYRPFSTVLLLSAFFGAGSADACTYSFVSAGSGAKMWMINTVTTKVEATIPAAGPLQQAVTADGATRYVVNVERDEVSVVDNATNTVKACIRVGEGPFGLALSLDGTKLFVLNRKSNSLSVIDTKLNKVVATEPAPMDNFGMHMAADGRMSMVK